jgi:hypothetical protein
MPPSITPGPPLRTLVAATGPEAELLLCCARLTLGDTERQRVRELLAQALDWDTLKGLAAGHGLLPLLYRHLEHESIPKEALVQLWILQETHALRNRALTKELCRIVRRLADQGIPAVPYKGPALAQVIYGDVSLRVFGDLDIVVRPKDLVAAKELLVADGYQRPITLAPGQEAALMRSCAQQHVTLVQRETNILVELHWSEAQSGVLAMARTIAGRLFAIDVPAPTGFQGLFFGLRLCERWWDRVRYAAVVLLVPGLADWTRCALPGWLSFLYYPLRLVRLVARRVPLLWRTDTPV